MFKNFLKIRSKKGTVQKGTALITALLVMGVLTAISLSVSALIVREISITRLALDAGKAYYTAESGMEKALLKLSKNPMSGFGEGGEDFDVGENGANGSFQIKNTATTYPVVGEQEKSLNPESYYSYLDVNDSVTIPLFTVEDEVEVPVEDFVVQYFVDLTEEDFGFQTASDQGIITGWDVLRWKVYGIVPEGDKTAGKTESINDFTSVALVESTSTEGGTEASTLTDARNPSWFGTLLNWDSPEGGYNYFSMGNAINYFPYQNEDVVIDNIGPETLYTGFCSQDQAREHYKYDGDIMTVIGCYPISEFLAPNNHNQNYLVLTNLMNPSVLNGDYDYDSRAAKSRLYYRVVTDKNMPREFAEITSVGEAGDSKITLSMLRKRDSFMPIFNFALYHSGTD